MLRRILKLKRLTLISLTALLFVSFCLLPCGGSGIAGAHEGHGSHEDGHLMHGESSPAPAGHACHNGGDSKETVKKDDAELSCLHCDTSSPAALQDKKNPCPDETGFNNSDDLVKTDGIPSLHLLNKHDIRPPGLYQPIHILNSTYLI